MQLSPRTSSIPIVIADARSLEQVQETFTRAAVQGERTVGVIRASVAALALIRHAYFNFDGMLALNPNDAVTGALIAVALLCSVPSVVMRDSTAWESVRRRLLFSITLDAVLVAGILAGNVVWPPSDYQGLLLKPYFAIEFVTIIVCGLRLSRSAAVLGALLNTLALIALILVDKERNPLVVHYHVGHIVYVLILMAAAGLVGVMVASRTRSLVVESAQKLIEASRVRARLGAYMAREVAEEALQGGEMKMGGRRQDVAVLFSDLRGFTAYSERLDPEQLVSQLNSYLETMVAAIQAEGGIVDKYIGDAIMAVFGAPRSRGDDAARAIRAASRMQAALVAHNADRVAKGLPALDQGIGVHHGPVVAGNVGTLEQAQYTIVGDTVNLASRLESMTKEQKVPVLISQAVVDAANGAEHPALRPCGTVKVRGREAEVQVFTLS